MLVQTIGRHVLQRDEAAPLSCIFSMHALTCLLLLVLLLQSRGCSCRKRLLCSRLRCSCGRFSCLALLCSRRRKRLLCVACLLHSSTPAQAWGTFRVPILEVFAPLHIPQTPLARSHAFGGVRWLWEVVPVLKSEFSPQLVFGL